MQRTKIRKKSPPKGVSAAERALAVLTAFRRGDGALSLAELAERTGLLKSTILRLAQSLQHYHLLARLPDGSYRLDAETLRLGTAYQQGIPPVRSRHAGARRADRKNRRDDFVLCSKRRRTALSFPCGEQQPDQDDGPAGRFSSHGQVSHRRNVAPIRIWSTAAIVFAKKGHWLGSAAFLIWAYAIGALVTERLFVIVKPKLLEIGWFAHLLSFVNRQLARVKGLFVRLDRR